MRRWSWGLTWPGGGVAQGVVTLCGRRRGWPLNQHIRVHCWRGGMRSGERHGLDSGNGLGFNVKVLEGGYKAYRRWVKQGFWLNRNH